MVGYSITLFAVSIAVGLVSGAMINVSIDHKWHDRGGLLGGILVGVLMALL
jgi:cytochrome bd-type quinol oxidase subunit 1